MCIVASYSLAAVATDQLEMGAATRHKAHVQEVAMRAGIKKDPSGNFRREWLGIIYDLVCREACLSHNLIARFRLACFREGMGRKRI